MSSKSETNKKWVSTTKYKLNYDRIFQGTGKEGEEPQTDDGLCSLYYWVIDQVKQLRPKSSAKHYDLGYNKGFVAGMTAVLGKIVKIRPSLLGGRK